MNKPLDSQLVPSRIVLNESKDTLTMEYAGDVRHPLPAEYLRVLSPSAEVRGHGRGQEVLQFGKRNVSISAISKSGNYAIQISFSDGHDSGIFSWDYLYELVVTTRASGRPISKPCSRLASRVILIFR